MLSVIREMQIKATMKYDVTPTKRAMKKPKQKIARVGWDMEKLELSHIPGVL